MGEETPNIPGHGAKPESPVPEAPKNPDDPPTPAEVARDWVRHRVMVSITDTAKEAALKTDLRIARAKERIADGQKELAEIRLAQQKEENRKLRVEIAALRQPAQVTARDAGEGE